MNTSISRQSIKKGSQFQFLILIDTITIDYKSSFSFKLIIKRGQRQIDTKNTYKYESPGPKEIKIDEELSITTSLTHNEDGSIGFKEKIYKVLLQVYTKQGFKSAAYSEINIAQSANYYANNNGSAVFPILINFEKSSFILLKSQLIIKTKYIGEIDGNINQADVTNITNMTTDNDYDDNVQINELSARNKTNSEVVGKIYILIKDLSSNRLKTIIVKIIL